MVSGFTFRMGRHFPQTLEKPVAGIDVLRALAQAMDGPRRITPTHDGPVLLLHSLFRPTNHFALHRSCKCKVCAVHSYWWSFVADTAPGVTLSLVGFIAAAPAYVLVRQSERGRARTAIAYLCGLSSGLFATMLLSRLLRWFVEPDAIVEPGVFSSFFFPFVGMARAKWERPRRRSRRAAMARVGKQRAPNAGGRLLAP